MMEHLDEEVVFSMKVLKQHRSAFERQVIEAVLIEMEDDGSLLNSKGGFNRCALPRLQVVIGDKPAENEERLTAFHDILTSQQTQGGKRKSVSKKTEDTSLPISPQKKKFKQDSVRNVRVERGKQKVRKKMDPNDRMKEAKAKARMKTKIFIQTLILFRYWKYLGWKRNQMTVDQMIGDRGPEVIKGHQDLKELPVELLRHLKRISGSKVLVCLLWNSSIASLLTLKSWKYQ